MAKGRNTSYFHTLERQTNCRELANDLRFRNKRLRKGGASFRVGPSEAAKAACVGKSKGLNVRNLRGRTDGGNLVLWPKTHLRSRQKDTKYKSLKAAHRKRPLPAVPGPARPGSPMPEYNLPPLLGRYTPPPVRKRKRTSSGGNARKKLAIGY